MERGQMNVKTNVKAGSDTDAGGGLDPTG